MARKRVNTKFLVILTVSILVFGVAGVGFKKLAQKQRPEKFITAGDELYAQGKFAEAAANYGTAMSLNAQDAVTRVKFGRALTELTGTNVEMVQRSRKAFEDALEVDPTYEPALEELLNYYIGAAQIEPRAEFFEKLRDYSQRILKIDPNHKRAKAYQSIAVIQGWLFGVETEAAKVDQHMSALATLMLADPTNPELPFYLAQAKVKRGQDLDRQLRRKDAEDAWAEAATVFDKPLADHGEIPAMHFRAAQVLVSLAKADAKKNPVTQLSPAEIYLQKAKEREQKALAIAKTDDPQFTEMYISAADISRQQGEMAKNKADEFIQQGDAKSAAAKIAEQQADLAEAEKIVRELLAKHPEDQAGRLFLAEMVGVNAVKRQEMIELLSKPVAAGQGMRGMKALLLHEYKLRTLIQLANLRMDSYVNSKDEKERDELLTQIKANYKSFTDEVGEIPVALKLKGKLQLLQNQPIDAIQTLSRALSLLQQQGQKDYDLMYVLAKAYFLANQTGQAKDLLIKVLDRYGTLTDARLLLTQMQLKENAMAEAKANLDILEKQAPTNPDVIKLRIALLHSEGKKDEVSKYFEKLPEGTRLEKLAKVQASIVLGDMPNAIRLLEAMRAENPGDVEASITLARVYASQKDKEKAKAVLKEAIEKNPDNKSLVSTSKLLDGAKPEELIQEMSSDEFSREMSYVEMARGQNDKEGFEKHLAAAAKLKPNDPQVLDYQFQVALQAKKFDVAASYLDALAATNKDQAKGQLYRFRLAMAKGNIEEALTVARDLTGVLPEFAQSWLSLAQALHANGQFDQAVQKYVIALEKQNANPDAIKGIIECYYRLNKPDDAKRYILQARQMFPNDPYFRELEITYNQNYGDPEKAIASREDMLASDPKQMNNWLAAGAAYLRAAQAKAATDPKQADAHLAKAREKFDKGQQQWPDERMFYGYLADVAMVKNDGVTAERVLTQLSARDAWKDKPEPYLMLAELYNRLGKADQTEKALRDALARAKDNVDVQIRLSAFLAQQRKTDEAVKVLDANSTDPRIQRQRIDAMISGGKFDDAEKALQTLLVKTPNDTQLLALLVVVYMNTGKYDVAVDRANQILTIDAKNPGALLARGLVRLNQGKYDEAVADLSIVRDQNPTNVEARLALADSYRRRNEPENAARELVAALKVIPMNKIVRLRLIELYCAMSPPRWSDADDLLAEAKANPQLNKDPDWYRTESKKWLAQGNPGKAVQSAEEAMKLAGDNPVVLQDYVNALLQAKNYRGIMATTDPLVEKKSDLWWIYQARGVAKKFLSDKAGAMEEFQKAMTIASAQRNDDAVAVIIRNIASEIGVKAALEQIGDRKESRWLLIKVYLYQADDDTTNAVRTLELAMSQLDKMTPQERDQTLRVAGTIYLTIRPPQVEKARSAYVKLLEKSPNDLQSLNNLACLLAEQASPPEPAEALKYSQRAYDTSEKRGEFEPLVIDTHGWVLVLNGRTAEGINTLRRVVDKRPFLDAHYHLGEAYLRDSNPKEAVKQLERASKMMDDMVKQQNQNVDLQMKSKIDKALSKARSMVQQENAAKAS